MFRRTLFKSLASKLSARIHRHGVCKQAGWERPAVVVMVEQHTFARHRSEGSTLFLSTKRHWSKSYGDLIGFLHEP
eukprot:1158919-Pelagomonas_calceolata.AAC.12